MLATIILCTAFKLCFRIQSTPLHNGPQTTGQQLLPPLTSAEAHIQQLQQGLGGGCPQAPGASAAGAVQWQQHGQGLTLVHFSAQLEPFLTPIQPQTPPDKPLTPHNHRLNDPYTHFLSHGKRLS